jgi:hypothetical protein
VISPCFDLWALQADLGSQEALILSFADSIETNHVTVMAELVSAMTNLELPANEFVAEGVTSIGRRPK